MSEGISRKAWLGAVIGSLAAIGGGFAFGSLFVRSPGGNAEAAASPPNAPAHPQSEVKALTPIVTNLGNPADVYVRLEAAILLDPDTPDGAALAAKVADGLVVYLRTVSLTELQGPTGFQYFREDLRKRVIRQGGGKIRDLLLTAFAVE